MPIPKAYSFPIRSAAVLVLLVLVACSSETITHSLATEVQPQAGATKPQATEIQPFKSKTLTHTTKGLATATMALGSPEPPPFPLTDPGPYQSGKLTYQFLDASRGDRPVNITVWYPAIRSPGSNSRFARHGAEPDFSGAPYPLILSSTKVARILAPYLVSHGFTWVSVDKIDTYYRMNEQMYQQPLDILFALEQVASYPPGGLEGMIDTEYAGAIGYSFDGYNTLAMSGA